jgi:hypothetical protein
MSERNSWSSSISNGKAQETFGVHTIRRNGSWDDLEELEVEVGRERRGTCITVIGVLDIVLFESRET